MTVTLFAQPYDHSATGFFFENANTFATKAASLRNAHGQPVEEFEIQFIDGAATDAALVDTTGLHQGDITAFFEKIGDWDEDQKRTVIIGAGACGYAFDWHTGCPEDFDVDIYEMESLRELAEYFVDEGLFGDIPERLQGYLDYDAIARDLGFDYSEIEISGVRMIYRCC